MMAPLSPEGIAPFGRTGDLGDDFRKANDHGYGNGEYVMLHIPEIIRSIDPFTLQVCMSRFEITLRRGEETDDKATIGYDPPLRTFFLQGFDADDDFGTPESGSARFWRNSRRWKASSRRSARGAMKCEIWGRQLSSQCWAKRARNTSPQSRNGLA